MSIGVHGLNVSLQCGVKNSVASQLGLTEKKTMFNCCMHGTIFVAFCDCLVFVSDFFTKIPNALSKGLLETDMVAKLILPPEKSNDLMLATDELTLGYTSS